MGRIIKLAGIGIIALWLATSQAFAQASNPSNGAGPGPTPRGTIGDNVAVCDPFTPANCLAPGYNYKHIASAATTLVKSGAGFLDTVCVNSGVASSTATLYDNTSAAAPIIATISTAAPGCFPLHVAFTAGLTLVTSGAADITVAYH